MAYLRLLSIMIVSEVHVGEMQVFKSAAWRKCIRQVSVKPLRENKEGVQDTAAPTAALSDLGMHKCISEHTHTNTNTLI